MNCFLNKKTRLLLSAAISIILVLSVAVILIVSEVNKLTMDFEVNETTGKKIQTTETVTKTDMKNNNGSETTEVQKKGDSSAQDELKTLVDNDYYYKVLKKEDCKQLIIVTTNGTRADVKCYFYEDDVWNENVTCSAYIGKNGSTENKTEGDGCTPLGLYKIGSAFYINEQPQTKLKSFKITEDSYWVDDVDSAYYNQYVTDVSKKDWNSAEHMIDYNGYRYGFVVDYNTECKPGAGSAIFFHIGYNPTAGCIATNEETIEEILSLLDENKNPFILIV